MLVKQLLLVQHPGLPSLRSWQFHSKCLGLRPCTINARHNEQQKLLQICPGIAKASIELHTSSTEDQAGLNDAAAAPGVALEVSHVSKAFSDHQVRSHSCSASGSQHMFTVTQTKPWHGL